MNPRNKQFPHILIPKVDYDKRIRKIIIFNDDGDKIHLKVENVLSKCKGIKVYKLKLTKEFSIL